MPSVFISYSHDPDDPSHAAWVAGLAASLMADGLTVFLDQNRPAEEAGMPWPLWMERKLRQADHVLLVCTPLYLAKMQQDIAPDAGRGVCWEANLIYNALYEAKMNTAKFLPVLLTRADEECIPTPFRGSTSYPLDTQAGYQRLYAFLLGKHQPIFPPVAAKLQSVTQRVVTPLFAPASGGDGEEPAQPHTLGAKERQRRQAYLKDLREHVENLQRESIHNARFLDLGTADTPGATLLPWKYKNTTSTEVFESIGAAFDAYQRRLLILGVPGAGKSVTLLALALRLIGEAEGDEAAPIPLIVNLSKFQFQSTTTPLKDRWWKRGTKADAPANAGTVMRAADTSFENWLAAEFAEHPDISRTLAATWLREHRVAALLDGLDEVNDQRRAELAALLNASYFRAHPQAPIIVCSRIEEYSPLQDRPETTLHLPGAITLQPLSPEQIAAYLAFAHATGLHAALGRDQTLNELAQTPLTLSMMALAYGGVAVDDIPSYPLLADQRHHLMQAYVARMLQRKERRDHHRPFDDDRTRDIAPHACQHHPQRVDRYLSWLAIRLSVGMQTACSLRNLYDLMSRSGDGKSFTRESAAMALARTALQAVIMAMAMVPLIASGQVSLLGALLALLQGSGIYLGTFAGYVWAEKKNLKQSLSPFVVIPLATVSFAAVARSLSVVLPGRLAPVPVGIIALAAAWAAIRGFEASMKADKKDLAIPAGTLAGLLAGWAAYTWHWLPWAGDTMLATMIGGGCVMGTIASVLWGKFKRRARNPFTIDSVHEVFGVAELMVAVILALLWAGLWLVGELPWAVVGALAGIAVTGLVIPFDKPAASLLGLASCAVIGGLGVSKEGVVLGMAGFYLSMIPWSTIRDSRASPRAQAFANKISTFASDKAQHWILSPAVCGILSVFQRLPCHLPAFLRYGGQALILKPFTGEVEFMHRRLREYFALHELLPRLRHEQDPQQRVLIITSLGYQGSAVIDLLGELIVQGRTEEKVAAVQAIAHISAPEVVQHLEQAMTDPAPTVREAVIRNLRNLPQEKQVPFWQQAADDPDVLVQQALIDSLPYSRSEDEWLPLILRMLLVEQKAHALLRHISVIPRHPLNYTLSKRLPESCKAALAALTADPFPEVRRQACLWMATQPHLAHIEAIIGLLRDPDATIRMTAASSLGLTDAATALGPLLETLTDPEAFVRKAAIETLRQWNDERAVEPLLHALSDKAIKVRIAAIEALGLLKNPLAFEPMVYLLAGKDAILRAAAADALMRFDHPQKQKAFIQCLADKAPAVRKAALAALRWQSDQEFPELVIKALADKDAAVRTAAAEVLRRTRDPRAVSPLIKALADKDTHVRTAAADALGRNSDARAVPPLIKALADKEAGVRLAATTALASHRAPQALDPLAAILNDPEPTVRAAAAAALAAVEDPRGKPALQRLLTSASPEARRAAVAALIEKLPFIHRQLLSRDLDFASCIDPAEPITLSRVASGAQKLGLTEEEVRAHYEALAEPFCLTLTW